MTMSDKVMIERLYWQK